MIWSTVLYNKLVNRSVFSKFHELFHQTVKPEGVIGTQIYSQSIRSSGEDFPGSPVDRKLPVNSEDTSLIPYLGSFHMQWKNKAQVPQLPKLEHPRALLCSATREATARKRPCTTTRETLPKQWRTSSAKISKCFEKETFKWDLRSPCRQCQNWI